MQHSQQDLNPKLFVARAYAMYPELAQSDFTAALFSYTAASNDKDVSISETPIDFLIELQRTIEEQEYNIVAFESSLFDENEICLMSKPLYQGIRSGTLANSEYEDFLNTANNEHLTKLDAIIG